MQRTLTATQLCSVNSSSFCLTPVQLWPPLLSSSQTISALLNFRNSFQQLSKVVPSLPTSAQLFLSLPCSSQLFSTTLTSAHLLSTLLNSSQLFSPLATSSTLPTSSHLRSTHLTSFTAYLNSSHLLNSGQLFSTLLTSCHKDAYAQSKLLHKASSYTEKLLHREAFIYAGELLHKASFCTEKLLYLLYRGACTQSKLLHREAFTHTASFHAEKLLHKASLCTEKLLILHTQQAFTQRSFYTKQAFAQRTAFTHSKLLYREAATQDAPKWRKICGQSNSPNFHAAITMRFTTLSCKTQKYYTRAHTTQEPWRCQSTAICRDRVAKHNRITHNGYRNCSSKTGSRRPSGKTTI